MRVSPTKEQTEYLRSIGVYDAAQQPLAAEPTSPPRPASKPSNRSSQNQTWLIIIFTIVFLILMAMGSLVAATHPSQANLVHTNGIPSEHNEKLLIDQETNAGIENGQQDSSGTLAGKNEPENESAFPLNGQSIPKTQELHRTSVNELNVPYQQTTPMYLHYENIELRRVTLQFAIVCVLLVALVYIRTTSSWKIMDLSKKKWAGDWIKSLRTSGVFVNSSSSHPVVREQVGTKPIKIISNEEINRDKDLQPEPALQDHLISKAKTTLKSLKVAPASSTIPWQLAMASIRGNVRTENQDAGIALAIGEFDFLIIADGCGGSPYGREASRSAVVGAGFRLIQILGSIHQDEALNFQEVIRSSIWAAQNHLACKADELNIPCARVEAGLRTTLIIAIAHKQQFHFGYIGDGGGAIMKTNGKTEPFLAPQKATDAPNVLRASLGPMLVGEPIIGNIARDPGDLVLIGTDGVFDRIHLEDFSKDVLRASIECEGDLEKVATQVCQEYADLKDSAGYICDDNLTLGLMGTRQKPVLGAGFWNQETETATEEPQPIGAINGKETT